MPTNGEENSGTESHKKFNLPHIFLELNQDHS